MATSDTSPAPLPAWTLPGAFVRTPAFASSELEQLFQALENARNDRLRLTPGAPADAETEVLWRVMRTFFARPVAREALYLASPAVYHELLAVVNTTDLPPRKLLRTLFKYVARMSARSTPFGLFAGCGVLSAGRETALQLGPRDAWTRKTRLDFDFLYRLCDHVNDSLRSSPAVPVKRNDTITEIDTHLHYVRDDRSRSGSRVLTLASVTRTPDIMRALASARHATPRRELIDQFCDAETTYEEAAGFIEELERQQILVSDIAPTVTARDPMAELRRQFERIPGLETAAATMQQIESALARLDDAADGDHASGYAEAEALVASLGAAFEARTLFQVDLVPQFRVGTLGDRVTTDVIAVLEQLAPITPRYDPLRGFKDAFVERWEQEEMPLSVVLDEEVGVAIRELIPSADRSIDGFMARRDAVLTEWVVDAATAGETTLHLTERKLHALRVPEPTPLPQSLTVLVSLLGSSAEAIERSDYYLDWRGASTDNAGTLGGRFAHADPAIEQLLLDIAEAELAARPGVMQPEIVHVPQGRLGNVIGRPANTPFELPLRARSALPDTQQVGLDDLWVSVRKGRVHLRSKRFDCEVIPRCTNAHNFVSSQNLPVYRFLRFLARQGSESDYGWNWGRLAELPRLPRVMLGHAILAPQTFRVHVEVGKAARTAASFVDRIDGLRARLTALGVPRRVLMLEGDNWLPLDLESDISMELLLGTGTEARSIRLQEDLAFQFGSPVRDDRHAFRNELAIAVGAPASPVRRDSVETTERAPAGGAQSHGISVQRVFSPTSEWCYVKVALGRGLADRLLLDVVEPVVQSLSADGIVDRWFFLRYEEPPFQVRVRAHGDPTRLHAAFMTRLEAALQRDLLHNRVARITYDTYRREVERYGGAGLIAEAEGVFCADSSLVAHILRRLRGRPERRTPAILAHLEFMLDAFRLPERTSIDLLLGLADVRTHERATWDSQFRAMRSERHTLREILDAPGDVPATERGRARMSALVQAIRDYRARADDDTVATVVPSFLHMAFNRISKDSLRADERRNLYWLWKVLRSRQGRARGAQLLGSSGPGVVAQDATLR